MNDDKKKRYESINDKNLTPAMRQYKQLKIKHPDCIIMFRMGDFFEMFYDDAEVASKVLDITLTSRGKNEKKAPLAGIPYHALNEYLKKFIRAGKKVAIVEQLENPKNAKGRLVKRDVVKIITPGTILDGDLLDSKENNYLSSLFIQGKNIAIALSDVSTGEVFVSKLSNEDDLKNEIRKYSPKECIIPESLMVNDSLSKTLSDMGIYVSVKQDEIFGRDFSRSKVLEYFSEGYLKSLGIYDNVVVIRCLGSLISYIEENERESLKQMNTIRIINPNEYMLIDSQTIKNLELVENLSDNRNNDTLFSVINKCRTSMGFRLMQRWLLRPLIEKKEIDARLDAVDELIKSIKTKEIMHYLSEISDLDRISSKIAYRSVNPRELLTIASSVRFSAMIKESLKGFKSELIKEISRFDSINDFSDKINAAITDNPPVKLIDGHVIREGYSKELDNLRNLKNDAKDILRKIEDEERKKTGISTLKIGYNNVFGYFIQISKSKADLVPDRYIIKQNLVSYNRYITPELKDIENKILGSEERIADLERSIYNSIVDDARSYVDKIRKISNKIANLDCLVSFAEISRNNNYVRPIVDNSNEIEICESRHPVVELKNHDFIPNDIKMRNGEIIVLTGPNMAGKSTYMRQLCLISIMAQMGCFVPAKSARIGIFDRIFSRVGAYDDLSHGQSTFMVEMNETANILNNATNKSLIILDEVGRGTSTYDGISIAWSVVEYIHDKIKAKTIFATHYHFLNKLEQLYENITNYQMLIKETSDGILFLRKIAKGGTDRSYGIEVAKLSGLPIDVIERARVIQKQLSTETQDKLKPNRKGKQSTLELFS